MKARIVASVAALTLSVSALALSAPAGAEELPVSPSVRASGSTVLTPRAAAAALEVLKFGKSMYDKYKTCQANKAVNVPCGNSDSANIREALARLDAIQKTIEANQDALVARLQALGVKVDSATMGDYVREIRGMKGNTEDAMGAWDAMMECEVAKSTGESTCYPYLAGLSSTAKPVDEAIATSRRSFLDYASKLPQDLPKTVEVYTGVVSGPDRHSLSFAMWQLAKSRQEADAHVANQTLLLGSTTPFVTPGMAREVNEELAYYEGLYSMYASVLYAQAQLQAELAAPGSAAASDWSHRADLLSSQIDRNILSDNVRSVAGTTSVYQLTPLEDGQIMMATKSGVGVIIYSGNSTTFGDRPMTMSDVENLGQGLKNYGKYSKLHEARADAFPADGWYEAYTPVQKYKVTPTRALHGFGSSEYSINQIAINYKFDDETIYDEVVRMKLLDSAPSWNSNYLTSCYGCRYWKWSFDKSLAKNAPWPATYEWEILEVRGESDKDHLFAPDYAGYGGYLKIENLPASRIATPQSGNTMVKWPTGFTPNMPYYYNRG